MHFFIACKVRCVLRLSLVRTRFTARFHWVTRVLVLIVSCGIITKHALLGTPAFQTICYLRYQNQPQRFALALRNNSNRVFPYKPSILGVFPLFLETPIFCTEKHPPVQSQLNFNPYHPQLSKWRRTKASLAEGGEAAAWRRKKGSG